VDLDYALVNNWAFTSYAETYLAFRTLSGSPPDLEPGRLIDTAPRDEVSGFILEVANASEFSSYEAFIEKVIENNISFAESRSELEFNYKTLEGNDLVFTYNTSGTWREMIFDWGSGVVEQRVGFNTTDWKQPEWPSGEGHGRIPSLRVNGEEMRWTEQAPVLSGPFLHLNEKILRIEDPDGPAYEVDYSATLPVFTSNGIEETPQETD
jgi:hypothetical protein